MIAVAGIALWFGSLVSGAISNGHPQWLDTATTIGYLAGVVIFAVGIGIWGLRNA